MIHECDCQALSRRLLALRLTDQLFISHGQIHTPAAFSRPIYLTSYETSSIIHPSIHPAFFYHHPSIIPPSHCLSTIYSSIHHLSSIIHLSIYLPSSIHLLSIHLSTIIYAPSSIHLYTHLSITYPSIHHHLSTTIHLYTCLSSYHPSIYIHHPSINLSINHPSIDHLSIYFLPSSMHRHPSIYISMYPSSIYPSI